MEPKGRFLHLPAIIEHRAKTSIRRAEAFCEVSESICGVTVLPPTPATFSMLMATASRFLNGQTALEVDIRRYMWIHSPLYCHTGVKGWKRRKARALRRFNMAIHQPWRKWLFLKPAGMNHYMAVMALASQRIETVLSEAFADAPEASGSPKCPLATMEAQLIVEFGRELRWTPQQIRHAPLKQLFQFHRCIRASKGDEPSDPEETRILAAHIRKKNEEEQRRRAAAENAAKEAA